MRALVPIAIFFGVSGIVYFAFIAGVTELVSVLLLIPLLVWLRIEKISELPTTKMDSTLQRVLLFTLSLYLIVMIVRSPAVFLLGFPLEKTPLIVLLVSWLIYTERKPLAQYGFRWNRIGNQALLGGFLYLGSTLIPLLITLGLLRFSYGFSPVYEFNLASFLTAMPFQTFPVGVSEEGFFRGYIQTRMMEVTGTRRAILYQAALFGVWHFVWHLNPLDILGMAIHITGAFLFGVFTGAFYNYTRSIAGLALFHGLSNSVELATRLDFTGVPLSIYTVVGLIVGLTLLFGSVLILFSPRLTEILKTGFALTDEAIGRASAGEAV